MNSPCPSQVHLVAWLAHSVAQPSSPTDFCCAPFVAFSSGLLLVSQGYCKICGNAAYLLPDFSAPGEWLVLSQSAAVGGLTERQEKGH